jgi:oligoendopeptidase F
VSTAESPAPFVPAHLDAAEWATVEPLYRALLARPLDTSNAVEIWLRDFSALTCAVSEHGERIHIDKACHTEDADIHQRFLHWITDVEPAIKPWAFELKKKYIACEAGLRGSQATRRFEVLEREWAADASLFRVENVTLEAETLKLAADYDAIQGAVAVDFRGSTYTAQQMGRFQEETDRGLREEAWRAVEDRRRVDEDALDRLFSKLLDARQEIARNAGMADYRRHCWHALHRFDYTPDDCAAFADAVESACLPVVWQLDRERADALGLEALRPWDAVADPHRRPPLRPFDAGDPDELVHKTAMIFDRIDPSLGAQFRRLKPGRNLDLESRPGKRPGGFQTNLERSRETFIFMNAVGLQLDVDTMLHEAGHAFHAMASFDTVPLVFQRTPGSEFCEVASMSMELLGHPHLDIFYGVSSAGVAGNPDGPLRAWRSHLERGIRILPWIATIDQFQHWLYTHPGHSEAERADAWLRVFWRFFQSPHVDWTGLDEVARARWQRQLHLFHYPFYYIEYGIALLGSLQVWLNYRRNPRQTLDALLYAFGLGNTRPLPELFAAAGLRFDFSKATLEPLLQSVQAELATLPA